MSCVTAVDNRWGRCDIKSTALLANILLREQAAQAGAAETILLRDGTLTEGSASAVHVVLHGELVIAGAIRAGAAQPDPRCGRKNGRRAPASPCVRRQISEAELRGASEVMLVGGDARSHRGHPA